ncbi:MAG: TolC family protein [Bryobacterales bacterium]|nr:TolC family protein [Bryobacterales bacterium]
MRQIVVLLTALAAGSGSLAAQVLTLDELLGSVERSYPALLAVLQEREVAAGRLLSAEGAFDFRIRSQGTWDPMGFYTHRRFDIMAEQPMQTLGTSVFGGYRVGRGSFSSSDVTKLETLSTGEWRGGFRVPLLRDSATDRRRIEISQRGIDVRLATLSVTEQRIFIRRLATIRYWEWVAAGLRLRVAEALLRIATERDSQIRETVELGQLPPIEITENQRAILERQGDVVAATRLLEQTAIELSIFYRDAAGEPLRPARDRLPPRFPEPQQPVMSAIDEDIAQALVRRPEIEVLQLRRQQAELDARLARNQTLPSLDLLAGYSRDFGIGRPILRPAELATALQFDFPLARRQARGAQKAAEARASQIGQQERLIRDRVETSVRDAYSALAAAFARVGVAREELDVARQLEEAERVRLDLGDSTLFLVNLRELNTASAAIREVIAVADYHRARADYRAAIAQLQ